MQALTRTFPSPPVSLSPSLPFSCLSRVSPSPRYCLVRAPKLSTLCYAHAAPTPWCTVLVRRDRKFTIQHTVFRGSRVTFSYHCRRHRRTMSTLVASVSLANNALCSCLGKALYASLTHLSAAAFCWLLLPANVPVEGRLQRGFNDSTTFAILFITSGLVGRSPITISVRSARCLLT